MVVVPVTIVISACRECLRGFGSRNSSGYPLRLPGMGTPTKPERTPPVYGLLPSRRAASYYHPCVRLLYESEIQLVQLDMPARHCFDPLPAARWVASLCGQLRSEEHTSELQSLRHLVCRLLLEKKIN